MKGVVKRIDYHKQFIAIETSEGQYSVVEVLENELPELGDVITGDLESLGGETLVNLTQNKRMDVYIQEIYADSITANRLLNAPL